MLIQFSASNYKSIDKAVTLSMKTSTDSSHAQSIIGSGESMLLPTALLFGANASGKSNILEALRCIHRLAGGKDAIATVHKPHFVSKRADYGQTLLQPIKLRIKLAYFRLKLRSIGKLFVDIVQFVSPYIFTFHLAVFALLKIILPFALDRFCGYIAGGQIVQPGVKLLLFICEHNVFII